MKWICVLAAALLALAITAAAEEDVSSAQLAQIAVSKMGETNQEAQVTDFGIADSSQIGYSSDANVTQTISYDNIGSGTILQWGESGDMPRMERTLNLSGVGESGLTWQWSEGDVTQTINVKNSENLYLKQIIGGLKRVLFPETNAPAEIDSGSWTFCGTAVNGRGGLPLCAEKIGEKVLKGKYTARDLYMLEYLEDYYDTFPSENNTPHIILTKWNITKADGNLRIKFRAHNFAKEKYNATLHLDLTQKINITSLDGNFEKINAGGDNVVFRAADENLDSEIKAPEKKVIELDKFMIPGTKGIEREVIVQLDETIIQNLKMKVMSE
ncbi:Uncharacterised protein [uncultured archaeon]|nr:Uncharacterised protein [uncultured archaeon]